jgi:hypothetical protein
MRVSFEILVTRPYGERSLGGSKRICGKGVKVELK